MTNPTRSLAQTKPLGKTQCLYSQNKLPLLYTCWTQRNTQAIHAKGPVLHGWQTVACHWHKSNLLLATKAIVLFRNTLIIPRCRREQLQRPLESIILERQRWSTRPDASELIIHHLLPPRPTNKLWHSMLALVESWMSSPTVLRQLPLRVSPPLWARRLKGTKLRISFVITHNTVTILTRLTHGVSWLGNIQPDL